jgi:hypothetical protein
MAPTEPHKLFMAAISPHMERLAVHDDTVITDGSLSELEGLISVEKLWTAPGVTDSIRDVIWKYLDTLRMLGIGISSTPPEMMSRFESIAASISSEVEGGAPMPDMFSLVARIQQEVGDAGLQPDR